MFKKSMIIVAIVYVVVAAALWLTRSEPALSNAPPTPTPSAERAQLNRGGSSLPPVGKRVDVSGRHQILNRKLGIPLDQLKQMSPEQITDLFEQNADRLEIVIYKRIQGKDGKEEWITIGNRKRLTPTPAPTLKPYPAPAGGDLFKLPQLPQLPQMPQAPQTTWKVFLPLVSKPPLDPVAQDIMNRLGKAKFYIDKLYQESSDPQRGFVKEYPGCPVGIINRTWTDWTNPRFVGDYYQNTSQPLGKVYWYSVGSDYDLSNVTFEANYNWNYGEPAITCDRYYGSGYTGSPGGVRYEIVKWSWAGDSTNWVDVTLGDGLVFQDALFVPNGTTVQVNMGDEGRYPAHRYTVRHAVQMGRLMYLAANESSKAAKLYNLITAYGFGADIYMPMFWQGTEFADDFMFQYPAYHDCDLTNHGVESTLPWGYYPHRYPYESKVCLDRFTYVNTSRVDRLVPALQAIHILNKYGNPDHAYPDPANPLDTTTPRLKARALEGTWNGYGIPAYLKDPAYASGVRTNAFLVLETMLGYVWGDSTSRTYADNTVSVLRQTQWGMSPFTAYQGETTDDGVITRPNHTGGAFLSWRTGGSYPYGLPPRTFLTDLLDWLGMPKEVEGPIPSNAETTLTYWQALRVYLWYKFGIMYFGGP